MPQRAIQLISQSEVQTTAIAERLAHNLVSGDVVALEGELGAGKTVFVRGLARGLKANPNLVSSPTFVIRQEYPSSVPGSPTLVHIDAYRLSGPDELESIGWTELLSETGIVIAVEWPSRIAPALPHDRLNVQIHHLSDSSRSIAISAPENLADRLRNLASAVSAPQTVKCRTCGKVFASDAPTFPFCSDRCRLADLGKWFSESYRTSRQAEVDDELQD